jgi:hypothetical protein
MTNGRDPSIFINFPGSLPMNYTAFELGHLPRGRMRKKRISTPGQ